MKHYTEDDVKNLLRAKVATSSLRVVASEIGVSHMMVHDVLAGHRKVTDRIAVPLGFKRVVSVTFQKVA